MLEVSRACRQPVLFREEALGKCLNGVLHRYQEGVLLCRSSLYHTEGRTDDSIPNRFKLSVFTEHDLRSVGETHN